MRQLVSTYLSPAAINLISSGEIALIVHTVPGGIKTVPEKGFVYLILFSPSVLKLTLLKTVCPSNSLIPDPLMLSQPKKAKEIRMNEKNHFPLHMAQSLTNATCWRFLADIF